MKSSVTKKDLLNEIAQLKATVKQHEETIARMSSEIVLLKDELEGLYEDLAGENI